MRFLIILSVICLAVSVIALMMTYLNPEPVAAMVCLYSAIAGIITSLIVAIKG